MNKDKTEQPENFQAFPVPDKVLEFTRDGKKVGECGMTMRDYFAAKAMPHMQSIAISMCWGYGSVSEEAYKMADAMLAERSKND